MKKIIYLDYAGATPVDLTVQKIIAEHTDKSFGNASSPHAVGRKAKGVIEEARLGVAKVIGAKTTEIVFTNSGTESDNLAILGVARSYKKYGRHIITTNIEHLAVLRSCQFLEKDEGFKITYLPVDKNGIIDSKILEKNLRPDTILISVMYANNEIGTVQPIKEISDVIKNYRKKGNNKLPIFHTDACQAAGALNLNAHELGVDLMTLNGSKIYGPKATGCLYINRNVQLNPILLGGGQERGLRPGTENPALIAGFAKALEITDQKRNSESKRLIKLRDYLISEILNKIPNSKLNGDIQKRLPNNLNFSFDNIDGEMLMLALDRVGVQVSTGSACSATTTGPSHVIRAVGNPDGWGNIRVTLGRATTKKELTYFFNILRRLVEKMRTY